MKTIKLPYKTNEDLTSILKQYSSVVRYSYNRFLDGKTEKDIRELTKSLNNIDLLNSWLVQCGIKDGKSVIIDAKKFIVLPDNPVPPTPPGPNPPGPDPLPPIPGAGFRVLFVVETKDLSTLPSAQVQSLTAKEVREYLDSHCVKEGNQPEYRIFDKDTDMSRASQVWKDAMARPRSSVPWIIVTNGKTGYEGPLPPNTAELMKLLKQYGGN